VNQNRTNARIFISCGQEEDSSEVTVAREIKNMLEGDPFNFDVYLADLEHTPHDVLRSVLHALEESEYFLFIDFKREQIVPRDRDIESCRGSLFSHQELAIATFLEIEQLRFSETGVELNGIGSSLQGRPTVFSNRNELVEIVREKVIEKQWNSNWLNALRINEVPQIDRNILRNLGGTANFYLLVIENMHKRKMALDCRVFMELTATNGDEPSPAMRDHVEQKWAGVVFTQAVAIRPKNGSRRVCACFVERNAGNTPLGVYFHQFGVDTDSAEVARPCPPGEFSLKYTVTSANFPTVSRIFNLVVSHDEGITEFSAISES
jgi:hypothetical protein